MRGRDGVILGVIELKVTGRPSGIFVILRIMVI